MSNKSGDEQYKGNILATMGNNNSLYEDKSEMSNRNNSKERKASIVQIQKITKFYTKLKNRKDQLETDKDKLKKYMKELEEKDKSIIKKLIYKLTLN